MFQVFLLTSIAVMALWFWQGSQLFFSPPAAAENRQAGDADPRNHQADPLTLDSVINTLDASNPPILGQSTGEASAFITDQGQIRHTTLPDWPALVAAESLPFAETLAERGEKIFSGKIISDLRCADCHAQTAAAAPKQTAPILLHSAWQKRFFRAGQIQHLDAAIRDCQERQHPDAALADADVTALVNYFHKLAKPTRFDAFLRGEADLSDQEQAGLKILQQQGCLACHQGVNLGGNSLLAKDFLAGDAKNFRKDNQNWPELIRVPSLRNLGYRSAFLADGSADLTAALQHLNTTPFAPKPLTEEEIADIKAFLTTLNQDFPDGSGVNDVAAP